MVVKACERCASLGLRQMERMPTARPRDDFGGSRRSVVLACSAQFVSRFGRFKSLFARLGNLLPQLTKYQRLAGPG
jgi:hypothetical protein